MKYAHFWSCDITVFIRCQRIGFLLVSHYIQNEWLRRELDPLMASSFVLHSHVAKGAPGEHPFLLVIESTRIVGICLNTLDAAFYLNFLAMVVDGFDSGKVDFPWSIKLHLSVLSTKLSFQAFSKGKYLTLAIQEKCMVIPSFALDEIKQFTGVHVTYTGLSVRSKQASMRRLSALFDVGEFESVSGQRHWLWYAVDLFD